MDSRSINFSKEFEEKEVDLGLYEIRIEGFYVYGFLRRILRALYADNGTANYMQTPVVSRKMKYNRWKFIVVSFFQLLFFKISRRKTDTFIYSFFRTDKLGENYIDKFTDPYIDNSFIKESYIIFEKSKDFNHNTPRAHSSNVIYTDYIEYSGIRYANKKKNVFKKNNSTLLNVLWGKIDLLMMGVPYDKEALIIRMLRDMYMTSYYKKVLVNHSVKRMFAPCRSAILNAMYACKELAIPVYEIQHGGAAAGISYSGAQNYYFTPDYFYSYGDLDNKEMWSIAPNRIFNIGWALPRYIDKIPPIDYGKKSVLVITNPVRTDRILDVIKELALLNPETSFYIRLHPIEKLSKFSADIIENTNNISIQDNTINISVVLRSFDYVVGETSTVLLEALSLGKKVGRLHYEGLKPEYMKDDEKDYEWMITDNISFVSFINDLSLIKYPHGLYSDFNQQLFEDTLLNNR